ncbi:MAG: PAS domain S-box protein [Proteobacteria bacterium]|nr:PAS domain S-box protein [Pseudomonadota bacterium]
MKQPPSIPGNDFAPLKAIIIITLTIFVAEIILMLLLRHLQIPASADIAIFADPLLLAGLMIPVFILFIYRPMNEKINSLKTIQAALQAREELFTLLLDCSTEAIYGLDRHGNCSFCNDSCVQLLGYEKKEDLQGRNMHSLIHHTKADNTPYPVEECRIYRAFMNGESVHLDQDILWKADGSSFVAEYWSSPIRRGDEIIGAVVNFMDISERAKTIEALQRESQINTRMAQLSRELLQEKSIEEISEQVLETAKHFTSSKFGFVGYIEQTTGHFVATTLSKDIWSNCQSSDKNIIFHEFRGMWGWVLTEGKSLYTNTPAGDPRSSGTPQGHIAIEKFLSAPAMIKGEIVGQIALANPDREYTEDDLQLIEKLADLYALNLQRQHSFTSLKASEERYKDLFDNNPHPMLIYDLETLQFLAVNDTAVRHYGYSRDEFLAMTIKDIRPPEDIPALLAKISAGTPGPGNSGLWRHLKKDGTLIWVDITSHTLDYMGRKAKFVMANDVTARKSAEEEIKLFSAIINQSNDAIFVVDPQTGSFLHANEKACENLGYTQQELLQKKVSDITAYISDKDGWQTSVSLLKNAGYRFFETEHFRKDGSSMPVEVNARIIRHNDRDYIVSVVRDLRERKAAEENLLLEKNKLEAVLAALGDGLTMQDRNFKILYQNAVHRAKQGSHTGEYCYEAYQNRADICPGCLLFKSFEDGKVHRRETSAKSTDGTIYLEVSSSPIRDSKGEIVAGIETVRDITERKKLEMQVQQSQKMQALGTLAGGIAHDFNNILTAIMGYAELVKLRLPEGENTLLRDQMEVLKACERAKELVKQILTFCRQVSNSPQTLKLELLVKEVLKLIRSTMPSTIEIRQEIQPNSGWVLADPTQLHQLILNLCTNALHAMHTKGGILSIVLKNTEIVQEDGLVFPDIEPGPYIMLEVGDTGHGMERATQERIYEPYFTTKKHGEGTGLGLSVVHGIVKGMKGRISVYSEINVGTTFKILLPRHDPPLAAGSKTSEPIPTGNESILFIDDEATIAVMGKSLLESLGYTVHSTADSLEGLAIFLADPDRFDLIISDTTMPHMTGDELTRKILAVRPDMPVILCTGFSETVNEKKARQIGARALVMKPLIRGDLAKIIRKTLDEKV